MTIIIKSERNAFLIIHNNFIYRINRMNRNLISWRCIEPNCSGSPKSSLNYRENLASFSTVTSHLHSAERSKAIRLEKLDKMKSLVFGGWESTRKIVQNVLCGADTETIRAMGNFETVYRFI